jgi:hypothetical protein
MLSILLTLFWCSLNFNVSSKITIKLKVYNNNFEFNNNFKNHITIKMTLKKDT